MSRRCLRSEGELDYRDDRHIDDHGVERRYISDNGHHGVDLDFVYRTDRGDRNGSRSREQRSGDIDDRHADHDDSVNEHADRDHVDRRHAHEQEEGPLMHRVGIAIVLGAALLGCGREGGTKATMTGDNRPTMNPVVPTSKDMPSKRVGGIAEQQDRLELTEYEIKMPDTLAAGHHAFSVVNSGKDNHSLVVEGPGVRTALAQQLTRGDSAQLDVDLKPGTYTFYCPVDGHRGKGMSRTVTVQ